MVKLMESISNFSGKSREASPVAWRDAEGLFIGHDHRGWLYRIMPSRSLMWEDEPLRREVAERLRLMFVDLGMTSRGSVVKGTNFGTDYRNFHLLTVAWDENVNVPENTPAALDEWLRPIFERYAGGRTLFAVGVELRRAGSAGSQSGLTISKVVSNLISEATGGPPDPRVFASDRAAVTEILERAGGRPPTDAEAARMESWWNDGRGCATRVVDEPDGRSLSTNAWSSGFEISALIGFEHARLDSRRGIWMAEAFGHHDGCIAASVRGELWPADVASNQFRKTQRRALARMREEEETGDLERVENTDMFDTGRMMEAFFARTTEPMMCNTSMLFARKLGLGGAEDYADYLWGRWGLEIKTLEFRQPAALKEMLPCSSRRIGSQRPFSQDLTIGVIAASGIGSVSKVGDKEGIWLGFSPPDHSPVWLDPKGASKANKPAAMAVIGDSGGGKTFLIQMIATQAARAGETVIVINPKAADSLAGFAEAIGGETITLSALERTSGMLDPFRYASPENAAEIAMSHISCVLSRIISDPDMVAMGAAFQQAVMNGARSVGECLQHPLVPPEAATMVRNYAISSSLFRLGISEEPQPVLEWGSASGLLLIQFDRNIPLPATAVPVFDMEPQERSGVSAVRLISRAAMELMLRGKGGVLVIDEAHVFLSSQEGRAVIQRLGREGRSQGILPVLVTQRIADVLAEGVDLGSYLSRLVLMKMTDEKEVAAALSLCELAETPERRRWLARAGPIRGERPGEGRPALALHKDLSGECAALSIGPVTDEIHDLFSTNWMDREMQTQEVAT